MLADVEERVRVVVAAGPCLHLRPGRRPARAAWRVRRATVKGLRYGDRQRRSVVALTALVVLALHAASGLAAPARARIRVDQVGFAPAAPKRAFLMLGTRAGRVPFAVRDAATGRVVLRGRAGADLGAWSARWPRVRALDISRLRAPGSYVVEAAGARSPVVRVGPPAALYAPLAAAAVRFLQDQRDGPDVVPGPLGRAPAHLSDARARVYSAPRFRGLRIRSPLRASGVTRDVLGGWFDAGDYLKFTETESFTDALLLFAIREYPAAMPADALAEARFGTDWLLRMWDPARGVLYSQVGIGDGDGARILGDHDLWRLPQADDALPRGSRSPTRYIARRPVVAANAPGRPISPNLAGRTAAALALCAQDFASTDPAYAARCLRAARQVYAHAARSWHGPLVTTEPHAYYPETGWLDDMELGAVELSRASARLGAPGADGYLRDAARWADRYMSSPRDGQESLDLYDVSALGHFDLARILAGHLSTRLRRALPTDRRSIVRDLRDNLALGARLARRDPFGLGDLATNVDQVPNALGYSAMAGLLDALTGSRAYSAFGRSQLDWVLGSNAWGTSFVVGAGSVFPRCLAHQVANLAGSLTGRGAIMAGATVDGPTAPAGLAGLGAPDGFRRCPAAGAADPFPAYDGRRSAYVDDVRSPDTSEPSDDYTALALLAFAQRAAG